MSTSREPERSPAERSSGLRRLIRAGSPRLVRANVIGLALAVGLGFALAIQANQRQEGDLESLQPAELVGILDNVSRRAEQLRLETDKLAKLRNDLQAGTENAAEAQKRAQQQLNAYRVIAGTVPAEGPGVTVRIDDPEMQLDYPALVDAVQELRAAGAEAIQVGDTRVVASTWFGTAEDGGLTVNGQRLESPITIIAIGDAHTLASGLNVPGGVVQDAEVKGATVTVTQSARVSVDALQAPQEPRYAQPVDPDDTTP